jgi:peroxiredoxin
MTKLITPGELAPDFELKDFDGKRVRLSDFRGKPVVLSFLRGFM